MSSPFTILAPQNIDSEKAEDLSSSLSIPRFMADFLLLRGLDSVQSARDFLEPPDSHYLNPWDMKDMDAAVKTVLSWRATSTNVCIFGDYDLDGISSVALLLLALRNATGWDLQWYLPSRFEDGYGLTVGLVEKLHEQGMQRLIMVDTGITAVKEVARANELGMEVVILDHHRPSDTLPDAAAVVDPWREDCNYFNKSLSAVGVALKFIQALYEKIDLGGVESYLELVCLGTLSDIMPLEPENRYILHRGMKTMHQSDLAGVRTLAKTTGESQGCVRSQDVLFRIAPLMNAPGRLHHPENALRLLLSDSEREAEHYLHKLQQDNEKRRSIEATITTQAAAQAQKKSDDVVMVVYGSKWHIGVLGIVASKLVQQFYRPVAVITDGDDGWAQASVRGVDGFNWHEALQDHKEYFGRWGGHAAAAGFSVRNQDIPLLTDLFAQSAHKQGFKVDKDVFNTVQASVEISLADLNAETLEQICALEPFGKENDAPLFLSRNLRVVNAVREVRGGHLQFEVAAQEKGENFSAIAFGMGKHIKWLRENSSDFDMIFEPSWNVFNNRKKIQLQVRAMGRVQCK